MTRSIDRRRAQFEFERQLRYRILDSSREQRLRITSEAYRELFERFPDHDIFVDDKERKRLGRMGAAMIAPFVTPGKKVVEVGCGRGDVLEELAHIGCECVGIEPSHHLQDIARHDKGFTILHGTADKLPLEDHSVDIVFSQQVLEHLHPNDVPIHFSESYRVLRAGGTLAVETPNRRTGPQDVSRGFTRVAEGLHLKEWSVIELADQFRAAGFIDVKGLLAPPPLVRRIPTFHRLTRVPVALKCVQDYILAGIPNQRLRTLVAKLLGLDDIFFFGRKPHSKKLG